MRRSLFTLVALSSMGLSLIGCPDAPAPEAAAPTPAPAAPEAAEAEAAPEAEPAEAAAERWEGVVVARVTGLRRAPSTDRQVQNPDGDGQVANWITHLYRGDAVTVVRTEDDWSWVEIPGGDEGWVQSAGVREAEGTEPATILAEARVFERPDPTRPAAGRTLPAGKYLLALDTHGDFSQVNTRGEATVWVRSADLVRDADELAVSRIINRVRWMKEQERTDGLEDLLEVARDQYSEAQLLAVLAAELAAEGEAPAAEAETEPAAAPVPAAAPRPTTRPATQRQTDGAPARRGATGSPRESGRRPVTGGR